MTIQNNSAQQYYNRGLYRTQSNRINSTIPDKFQRNFDNYSNSLSNPDAGNSSNPMPSAPQNVKDAWEAAAEEVGGEGLGLSPDGKLSFLSSYTMAQLEQRFQTGSGDMFGSTVDSALAGAQKILDRLNNPLTPPRNGELAMLQGREKLFYQQFIENLIEAQGSQAIKETSPAAIYEQMTGRTVSAAEPTYNLTQEQADDLKSRYDMENITAEDYRSLVDELSEAGVVSKAEAAATFATRPIVVGAFPSDAYKQNFTYDSFTGGNFLEWAENLAAKYESGIDWILHSDDNGNDEKSNEGNIARLQKAGENVNRMAQLLKQLK